MGRQSREKAERRRNLAAAPPVKRRRGGITGPIADDTSTVVPWIEVWRAHRLAFLAIFAVALGFRVAVLLQTSHTPFLDVANIDSGSYQKWAHELVERGWRPTRIFYQSPFYAYFLAGLYRVFGDGPWAPRIAQILLGSLTAVLVYGIGTRLFNRRAAWIGALLVALFAPLVLEEVTLSKTTPLIAAAVGGVAAYFRYAPGAHPGGLVVAGILSGLAVIGIAQWLLPFIVLAAWLPWMAARAPKRRPAAVAAFVGAALLVIGPVVGWNSAHGGGLILTSGGSGLNLYEGNNERATGLAASPRGLRDIPEFEEEDSKRLAEEAMGRPLAPAAVERYWSGRALTYIREHPGDWLRLLLRKLTVLWNSYEIPDNYHFAFMREHFLTVLRGGVTLGVVAPLAIVGALMPFWRRRGLVAFTGVWLAYMVTPLAYYVRGRYRLPLVPFLALLAGLCVERLLSAARQGRWDRFGGLAAALLVAALFVNHEYCEPPHHGVTQLCFAGDIWYDLEWMKLAAFYQERGDLDATIGALEHAADCTVPRSRGQIAFWRGSAEWDKGKQLEAAGDRGGAAGHLRLARDAFQRCQDVQYRPDAASFNRSKVEEHLARLE